MAIDTIKFKRGVKSKLNNLSYGEPAYISDENELYIGTENGVEKITRNKEVAELSSQLEHIEKYISDIEINVLCLEKLGLKSLKRNEDTTTEMNALISYCENRPTERFTLKFPKGTYIFTSFKMLNNVNIEGCGSTFKSTSSTASFFYLPKGDVQYKQYRNFNLYCGVDDSEQIGIDLVAIEQDIPNYTGGIWYSDFENINIRNFKIQLNIYCEDGKGDMANQFLNFTKVNLFPYSANQKSLVIQGQLGQTVFDSCDFSCQTGTSELLIDLKSLTTSNDNIEGGLHFYNCTIQNAKTGINCHYVRYFNIENSWFENLENGITAKSSSIINISKTWFANNSNYAINSHTGELNVDTCMFIGTMSNHIVNAYNNFSIINSPSATKITNTTGFIALETNNTINFANSTSKCISLSNGGKILNVSNLKFCEDSIVYVHLQGNSTYTATLESGGNINLPPNKKLLIKQGDTITFRKVNIENIGTKHLIVSTTCEWVTV